MTGIATIAGGVKHGLGALTHAEREAARNVLEKLKSSGRGPGSNLGPPTQSATVYGGSLLKTHGVPSLIRGEGSDTFMGGVRSTPAHTVTGAGNDTVLSGSTTTFAGHTAVPDAPGQVSPHISLSADTINVAGATAESVKAGRPEEATTKAHTVTLPDKTTVTITGLSQHDITKLHH
jgi:hypothetical protein